jgi:hypothetical protein
LHVHNLPEGEINVPFRVRTRGVPQLSERGIRPILFDTDNKFQKKTGFFVASIARSFAHGGQVDAACENFSVARSSCEHVDWIFKSLI